MTSTVAPLRVRWLGRVAYREALALQTGLFESGSEQHLLLLEHPHVFTHGMRADLEHNLKCEPAAVGAELVPVKRGGDITYHGPGQLVGYPILNVDNRLGAAAHVCGVEGLLIDALRELGLPNAGRLEGFAGVWLDVDHPSVVPRKIAAIGVRLRDGRTMHGFALNVATDLTYMREHIVACGIPDRPVTSLAEEGVPATMREVVDIVGRLAAERWGGVSRAGRRASERPASGASERQDVAWRHRPDDLSAFSRGEGPGSPVRTASDHGEPVRLLGRLADAGVLDGHAAGARKPEWLRPKVAHGPEVLSLKRTMRELDLVTVCEEAGCPNLSECWADGTATFMINGDRCTRACGFCLVDTQHPLATDPSEPARVADAVERMGLRFAVVTAVARCTASRSTSRPTCRCSATSSRAASSARPSRRCRRKGSTSRSSRRPTRSRCGRPAHGEAAPRSGRTSPGGIVPMTCRPSPGELGRVRSCGTRRST